MENRPSKQPDDPWQPHEPASDAQRGGPAQPRPGSVSGPAEHSPTQPFPSGPPLRGPGSTPDWAPAPGPTAASWPEAPSGPVGTWPNVPEVAEHGAPSPERSRGRRLLAGAALATGLAVGGAGVAAAMTSGGQTLRTDGPQAGMPGNGFFPGSGGGTAAVQGEQGQPGQPGQQGQQGQQGFPGRPDGPGDWHHGRGGRGFAGGELGTPLHGELVVPQQDGTGTRRITVQTGTVTSVSATRLSVRSTDGFQATYVVTSRTQVARGQAISAVKSGHTVAVVASKSGSTLTAIRIGDRSMQPQRPDDDRRGPESPIPSPTRSGASTSDT